MKRATTAVVVALALCGQAIGQDAIPQESYLCIGTQATGFRWTVDRWSQTALNAPSQKFVVSLAKEQKVDQYFKVYELSEFGMTTKSTCYLANGEFEIKCGDLNVGFLLNKNTMRYHSVYGYGFTSGDDMVGNTPALTLGTCSRLN